MEKIVISFFLAVSIIALLVGGLYFFRTPERNTEVSNVNLVTDQIQNEINKLVEKIDMLEQKIHHLEAGKTSVVPVVDSGPSDHNKSVPVNAIEPGTGKSLTVMAGDNKKEEIAPPEILRPYSNEMQDYVYSLIKKERMDRQIDRKIKAEERRKLIQEFSKGPYDRYNLKVNSMGSTLNLDDGQKDGYFELIKQCTEECKEAKKNVNWRDKVAYVKYMKEQNRLITECNNEVERILTAEQLNIYNKLPAWSKNPVSKGYVAPPDDNNQGFPTVIKAFGIDSNLGNNIIQIKTSTGK